MDPNANLQEQERLLSRRRNGRDRARLRELREALWVWLRGYGFEPEWHKCPKATRHYLALAAQLVRSTTDDETTLAGGREPMTPAQIEAHYVAVALRLEELAQRQLIATYCRTYLVDLLEAAQFLRDHAPTVARQAENP